MAEILGAGEALKGLAEQLGPAIVPLLKKAGTDFERVYNNARIVELIEELRSTHPHEWKKITSFGKRAERERMGDRWMEFLRALILAKVAEAVLRHPIEWGKDATASEISAAYRERAEAAKEAAKEALLMVGRLRSFKEADLMIRQVESGFVALLKDLVRESPELAGQIRDLAMQAWGKVKRWADEAARRLDNL